MCSKFNKPFSAKHLKPLRSCEELNRSTKRRRGGKLHFFTSGRRTVLQRTHRGSTVCPEESSKTGRGAPFFTKWSKNTTIPLFSCLDPPSEQQRIIKLTSQQARALALASRSIVVHSEGNSFFQGIPGQKARVASAHPSSLSWRWEMGTVPVLLCEPSQGWALKRQPFNPWQPWRTKTDLLFVFDVEPLSRHILPEERTVVHAKASDHCWGCNTFYCCEAEAVLAVDSCAVHLLGGSVFE